VSEQELNRNRTEEF